MDVDEAAGGWVALRREGSIETFWTGPRALAYLRRQVLAVALALFVGGLLLSGYSAWGWLAVMAAPVVGFLVIGRWVRARPLLSIDRAAQTLTSHRLTEAGEAPLPIARLEQVVGAWETFGWSSRSAVYALERGGAKHLVLDLGGTNDPYAIAICTALGQQLALPASYLGPEGEVLASFDPIRPAAPG